MTPLNRLHLRLIRHVVLTFWCFSIFAGTDALAVMLKAPDFIRIEEGTTQKIAITATSKDSPITYLGYERGSPRPTFAASRQSVLSNTTLSGTATLEAALFKVPQVVCYKGSSINYFIGRRLVKSLTVGRQINDFIVGTF